MLLLRKISHRRPLFSLYITCLFLAIAFTEETCPNIERTSIVMVSGLASGMIMTDVDVALDLVAHIPAGLACSSWLNSSMCIILAGTSKEDQLTSTFRPADKDLILDYGCEKATEPKVWRRGAAKLRHDSKLATFNSAYINPHVEFDFQNVLLDEPAEDELIQMLGHSSLMRDSHACKNMVPAELWDDLPPDPEIEALKLEREQLKGGRYSTRTIQGHH
ncbi:hypothetical protein AN958_10674 [Leucoagaricus sp. SymC.cos]|nr:hypothetical protein AN958_10674 [Leucoagaricus sp. SymC.cos]